MNTNQKIPAPAVVCDASGSAAAPEYMKDWLTKHLEGFYGPRSKWSEKEKDKYHTDLGLLYCYETDKPSNISR